MGYWASPLPDVGNVLGRGRDGGGRGDGQIAGAVGLMQTFAAWRSLSRMRNGGFRREARTPDIINGHEFGNA